MGHHYKFLYSVVFHWHHINHRLQLLELIVIYTSLIWFVYLLHKWLNILSRDLRKKGNIFYSFQKKSLVIFFTNTTYLQSNRILLHLEESLEYFLMANCIQIRCQDFLLVLASSNKEFIYQN